MRVLFVLGRKKGHNVSPFIISQGESLKNNGVEIDYFIYNGGGFINYLKAIFLLIKKLNNNKYDIIHPHYSYSALITILSFPKIPIITSLMGSDILGFRKIDKIIKYFVEKFSNFIIVKSKEMQGRINAKGKSAVIPNGVDFNVFKEINKSEARRKVGFNKSSKYIIWIGKEGRKEKNYKLAKESFSIIKNSVEDVEMVCVYGKTQEELKYYYNACDILLLTSLYEGSPNVVKEAMACNCPIVSTDVGDVREVIGNTEGCYITSFNPEDVADKIQKVLDFGKRTNGRTNIQHLEINNIAKKIIDVYKKVLG